MRIKNPYTLFGNEQPLAKVTRYEYFVLRVTLVRDCLRVTSTVEPRVDRVGVLQSFKDLALHPS